MSGPKVSSDLISCVKTATKGCHICLWYPTEEAPSVGGDWIVDYDEIEEGEGGPDFAIDPEDNLLTVRNVTSEPRTYYLSLQKGRLLTEDGDALETGESRDDSGLHADTTTIISLIPPMKLIDVGYISCDDIR
ncbi:hypothetical protein FOZ63_012023, partial [Perkinsus olseni]